MRLRKQAISLGMVGIVSFILSDVLGCILVQGYNPIKSYISVLSADQTPHSSIMRTLIIIYQVCFLLFSISLCLKFYRGQYIYALLGSMLLFSISCLSLITFGVFPMTAESAINLRNVIHLILAIAIISSPPIALFLLFLGYRQYKLNFLRRLSLTTATFIVLFNLLHLVGIKNGWNILGLIQRLSVYTFHAFTFFTSWSYVRTESRAEH